MNIEKLNKLLKNAKALLEVAPEESLTVSRGTIKTKKTISGLIWAIEAFLVNNSRLPPETGAEMLERIGTDAGLWVEEFVKRNKGVSSEVQENLWVWFANAFDAGRASVYDKSLRDGYDVKVDTDREAAPEVAPDAVEEESTECMCFVCQITRALENRLVFEQAAKSGRKH